MDKWTGQVGVVTGASSGIGRAVARRLAEDGMTVAALARRKGRLDDLVSTFKGKGKIVAYKCDVTIQSEVEEVFKKIETELGAAKVLVNNAGIAIYSPLSDFNFEDWRKMFDTNFYGLMYCTKQFVDSHKKNTIQQAHIININSIAGHNDPAFPEVIIYSCTKHCVTMITRYLMKVMPEGNIRFTSVSPGAVSTEVFENGKWPIDVVGGELKIPLLQPEDVAGGIVSVLSAPENVVVSEFTIKPLGETF